MVDDSQPVEDDEFVYRRIHETYYKSSLLIPVERGAFKPTESDDTGLSVFRALFVQPKDTLSNVDSTKRDRCPDITGQTAKGARRSHALRISPMPSS